MYAYAWMRNNLALLGSTGENIYFAGDSAGGNLVTGLCARCVDLDIPGPKGLILFYPSMLAQENLCIHFDLFTHAHVYRNDAQNSKEKMAVVSYSRPKPTTPLYFPIFLQNKKQRIILVVEVVIFYPKQFPKKNLKLSKKSEKLLSRAKI